MKMKTTIYSLAAATLLGAAANAQTSSVTDPVGFHTINVGASTADGARRISLVSPGLVNPIEFASASTTIDATTVNVDGTPFAGLDFGTVAAQAGPFGIDEAAYNAFYVEVTSGDEAGAWANITANGDGSLTVDRDLSAASGDEIAIRKHVTIADFLGAANEAGLGDSPDGNINVADEVILFSAGTSQIAFFVNVPANSIADWFTTGLAPAGNIAIEPQQGVQIVRKQASPVSFTRAGHVKTGPTQLMINPGVNVVANPRAVGMDDDATPVFTLGSSDLFTPGGSATSVVDSADGNIATADEVTLFGDPLQPFSSTVYFRITAPAAGFDGWFSSGIAAADDVVIENGTAFLIQRKDASPFIWTSPAEVIAAE